MVQVQSPEGRDAEEGGLCVRNLWRGRERALKRQLSASFLGGREAMDWGSTIFVSSQEEFEGLPCMCQALR